MSAGDPGVPERRAAPRRVVNLPTHILVAGKRVACRLVDVSAGGALVAGDTGLVVGAKVELEIPGTGTVVASVIRVTPTHIALVFPGVLAISPLV
ncbi:MAG: PilZ domain-containing protein [Pseudomonadota bacterium]